MKYKVGDKVRVKKDLEVGKKYGGYGFFKEMEKFKDKTLTIEQCVNECYYSKEDSFGYQLTNEMLEPATDTNVATKKKNSIIMECYNGFKELLKLEFEKNSGMQEIANYYGFKAQANQLMEECAELIQALNKMLRFEGLGQPTDKDKKELRDNLIEEIADVLFLIDQIKFLKDIDADEINEVYVQKVKRTLERM